MPDILIYGPIGMGWGLSATEVIDQLADANGAEVTARINSAGGSFDEGPAIYNALREYSGRVNTVVDGVAYSMASLILQAGKTRRMAANSVLMVHGAQFQAEGSAEEMRKAADMMDVHTEAMVSAFVGRGIAEDTVRAWLTDGEDHYFTAENALAVGLIDEISEEIDMAAAIQNIPVAIQLPPQLAAYRKEEKPMPESQDKPIQAPGDQAQTVTADGKGFLANREKTLKEGTALGQKAEGVRQNHIRAFFEQPQFTDPEKIGHESVATFAAYRDVCLNDVNMTLDKARAGVIEIWGGMAVPVIQAGTQTQVQGSSHGRTEAPAMAQRYPQVSAGPDQADKFKEGVTAALEVKAGLETKREKLQEAREGEFLSMSAYEMARRFLEMNRIQVIGQRREQIIGQAMVSASGIAHSTSDFANILENVANKAMMMGWDEAPETWQEWARTGTLPDFKQGSRVNLSTFGDLDMVYENGEYKYGSFSDLKEPLQLATYGKLFGISRQALANDDLSALSAIPRAMGRSAARKIGDLAYNVLISNPVLNQDSTAVFDATHNNIGTAGPIAVAPGGSLDEAWTAMRTQTDPQGTTLNITPAHLVVPAALEISTGSSIADKTFADTAAAQERANPFQNRLTVTADARLDANSTTAWYALASGTMHDTVEVAFLNGQQTPYLESKDGWSTDGVEYKVRIDAVAAALDFRTMFFNAGS